MGVMPCLRTFCEERPGAIPEATAVAESSMAGMATPDLMTFLSDPRLREALITLSQTMQRQTDRYDDSHADT